jgi:lipoprotein-anchoring transpeptidase ErfK/SrfK
MRRTVQRQNIQGSFAVRSKIRLLTGLLSIIALPVAVLAQNTPLPTDVAPPVVVDPPVAAPPPVTPPVQVPTPPPVKPPVAPPKKKGPVDAMKPGQFVWEQRAYEATNLRIIAVLDIQRIYVFDGDTLVAFSTMSTGKKGHPTPAGVFNILQKNIDHKSNLYSNAPMPYMQRLTWDGIALHAGHNPGYPASHGCIRLPLGFAKALYQVTKMDQPVVVLKDLSTPPPKPAPKPEPAPQLPVEPVPEVPVEPVPVPVTPSR